jgi:hypothetical protein
MFAGHAGDYPRQREQRNTTCAGCVSVRKSRAEQDCSRSPLALRPLYFLVNFVWNMAQKTKDPQRLRV